jgi:hypothetical protein
MANKNSLHYRLAVLATFVLLVSRPCAAANAMIPAEATVPRAASTIDVSLGTDGTLQGQVVLTNGQMAAGATMVLFERQERVAVVRADQRGQFSLPATGGNTNYQIAWQTTNGENGLIEVRAWTSSAAPPHAKQELVLQSQINVIRGQYSSGGLGCFLTNPWVMAGLITAAIALPIALTNDDSAS